MDISDDPEQIRRLLTGSRTIAVVGCSPRPGRPSHKVAKHLIAKGYDVVPVNPGASRILGKKCYPDLGSVPRRIDIVDVFRSPELVPVVVEEAIAVGAECLWLQEGAVHEAAARKASGAGLYVVRNLCLKAAHDRLIR